MGILLEINFLKSHYHGEMYPPAPATVFQALVAGGYPANKEATQEVLRAMETWGPPTILCPGVSSPSPFISHPRDNVEAHNGLVLYGRRKGRNPNQAIERRCRLFQAEQQVKYFWNTDIDESMLRKLQFVATHLYRLGRGEDDAFAVASQVHDAPVPVGWTKYEPLGSQTNAPRYNDLYLTAPVPGSLALIEWKFETQTPIMPGTLCPRQAYRPAGDVATDFHCFELRDGESGRFLQCRFEELKNVTAWFRRAANIRMKDLLTPDQFNGYLGGHHVNKELENQRIAFLPLPSLVGNGRIRRFMLAEPRLKNQRYAGILSQVASKLAGPIQRLDGDAPPNTATEGDTDSNTVDSVPITNKEDSTLNKYTKVGRVWTTVTPIVLHGHNIKKRKLDVNKTDAMLLKAFEMAGLAANTLEEVTFHRTSQIPGIGEANRATPPNNLAQFPRYHVSVKFREALAGPITAGIGRHRGFGTFVCMD